MSDYITKQSVYNESFEILNIAKFKVHLLCTFLIGTILLWYSLVEENFEQPTKYYFITFKITQNFNPYNLLPIAMPDEAFCAINPTIA